MKIMPNFTDSCSLNKQREIISAKSTALKPFSFDERDRRRLNMLENLREESIKRSVQLANSFRAQLMPVGSPDALPPKMKRPSVVTQPFKFRTDSRIKHPQDKNSQKSPLSNFTRTLRSYTLKEDPMSPTRACTVAHSPTLLTKERATKRTALRRLLELQQASISRRMRVIMDKRRSQEDKDLVRLRRSLVHRPEPIRRYKPLNPSRQGTHRGLISIDE